MKHASLFSGIGGFDLAAQWMGWDNVLHCEMDKFCQTILNYYWPKAKLYEDIKTTDFTVWRGQINILTGGFPCQPYSQAGKRKGTKDDRHLWPEMLRAIREIQPSWVVGENVSGLINWNGGLVFEEVQADLEAEGYEVQPFILPAAGLNAPHRRERVWFVAYTDSKKYFIDVGKCRKKKSRVKQKGFRSTYWNEFSLENGRVAPEKWKPTRKHTARPLLLRNDNGISSKLDGITFPKWRNESIKGYGNAVVPQVVYEIFKVIEEMELNYLE